jgi:AraC family transcriptional regulator of adaptative response/methylated-DNA-[protein]-cysteine methyltransferase
MSVNAAIIAADCPELELVQRICDYIEQNIECAPTLTEIGAHFHMSHFHLQRTFKRVLGITPRQYAEGYRLENLKGLLRDGQSVTSALYDVGYGSSSRLYERAPDMLGMTPLTYSRGGAGMEISYMITTTRLGRLMVAKTERGVCAVHIRQTDEELREQLYREYPLADIVEKDDDICSWVRAILNHIEGTQPHLDLPLDVQATAFQLNVWQALRDIPYGETRTYASIAQSLGKPKAASAVAKAIDANPLLMVIPCHRTECQDGEPSHYYTPAAEETRRLLRENEHEVIQRTTAP